MTSVSVILRAQKDLFVAAMKSVHASLDAVIARMEVLAARAKMMLLGLGGSIAGLVLLAGKQEKAEAKLESVLRATGYAAGFSADQMKKLASEMQKQTGIGDEVIVNAQGILATFRNIKGDVFSEATKAMLDMSAVMDGDLKGSAIQLGKALNDPIQGVSALRRVGVSFTSEQLKTIKSLQETGDVMGAQKVILTELASEFGGAAANAARGFSGQLKALWERLSDIGETLGKVVLPTVLSFAKLVESIVTPIGEWANAHKALTQAILGTTFALLGFAAVLPKVIRLIKTLVGVAIGLSAVGATITSLGASLGVIIANIAPKLGVALAAVLTPLVAAAAAVAVFVAALGGLWLWQKKIAAGDKAAADAAKDYSEVLDRVSIAAKRVATASTDADRISAIKERIQLEEEAAKKADEQHAALHQKNIARLIAELGMLESTVTAQTEADEAKQESFEKELAASTLAAEQAGKAALEQERLALAAREFTEEQIKQIMAQKELADARTTEADAAKKADEDAKKNHENAIKRLEDIQKEIYALRGESSEAAELFDLVNINAAREDVERIGEALREKVLAETAKETAELQKQLQERLAGEAMITAQREAQAAASSAGRFEGLTDAWQRIQSAAVRAPIERESALIEKQKEAIEQAKVLSKIQEESKSKLQQIADALAEILRRPAGATFS